MNRFELPNGITYDDKKFNQVFLKEMTGVEQDLLANSKYKSRVDHIEPILLNVIDKVEDSEGNKCSASNDIIVKDLLEINDIEFLLVKLKEITYDEIHIQESVECTHCKHKQDTKIELNSLEIIPPKEERDNIIKLPKSGKEVEFKHLCYKDLKKFAGDPERLINNASTSAAAMRIKRIDDNYNVTEKDIKALPAKDITEINKKAPEGSRIDINFEHTCSKCEKDFNYDLEVLSPDFLTQ